MLVAIAVFTTSVFAQPAPTFKGHQIGESVMDFLTVEAPTSFDRWSSCNPQVRNEEGTQERSMQGFG